MQGCEKKFTQTSTPHISLKVKTMLKTEFEESYEQLTPRQKEIMKPFLAGQSDLEICQKLFCTEANVRAHIKNIRQKFDASDRKDLVYVFFQHQPDLVADIVRDKAGILPAKQEVKISGSLGTEAYIERSPVEANCYQELTKPGSLIRIKAPQGMGKTRLVNQILKHAKTQGYQTITWNLQQPNAEVLQNLDKLLRSLCEKVRRKLRLQDSVSESWDEFASANDNCTYYFEDYVLEALETPLVLALDNVDEIFRYPEIASDFLKLLRSWHEEAKNNDLWQNLHLIVAHSTEAYIAMDTNHSPFNVGLPVELPEFNQEQVQEFSYQYGLNLSNEEIEQLMAMVGGHPYLVQKAFYCLTQPGGKLETFLEKAVTEAGDYNSYLLEHLDALQDNPKLKEAMYQIVTADAPVRLEPGLIFQLDSMGLIRKQGNEVEPRNNLFRIYFRERLNSK